VKSPRESDLVRAVLQLLALRKIPAWRQNAGVVKVGKRLIRLGPAGSPDVVAVIPPAGRLLACECKAKGGRLRPAQRAVRDNLTAAGAAYLVITDIRDLDKALAGLGVRDA
jgi:hypothetical protein